MNMENEIFKIYDEINMIQDKISSLQGKDPVLFEQYTRNIFDLKRKMQRLEKELYLYRDPDLESDEIDLYVKNFHSLKEDSLDYLNYIIVEHGTKNKIGEMEIRFSLLKSEQYLGNIGAEIKEEYRGQRYSKKAFTLLRNVMLEKGLTKPIFTVKETNTSSIKSLDTIGAKRIGSTKNDDDLYYIYEYDLEQTTKNK